MRIAIFTETAPPSVNGVVRRLDQTIRELTQSGDEVMVFAPAGGPSRWHGAEVVGAPCFPLPWYPEILVGMPHPAMRRRLARFAPDVVHAVNPAVLAAGGLFYARTLGIPMVASFHTHLPRYLHHYGLGVFEQLAWDVLRSFHNQADLNIAISRPVAEELRRRGLQRVELGWRGGVDTSLFDPRRASAQMRARLTDGHPEAPLVVCVGRLGAEKGLELIGPMLDRLSGARVAFIGDGPYRGVLEEQLASRPAHFAGYLKGYELATAVASADVLVFPSQTDTLGLVMLEAMAAGTPVVAADTGGTTDLVEHGLTGLLFPPGDAAAAAGAVRRLLDDRVTRELVRVAGRAQAERWTWKAAAQDLRRWYRRAIDRLGQPKAA
ncbi:MAG TPA: glycosyltransferase [Candidatus Dormibacteraeota bacterium]